MPDDIFGYNWKDIQRAQLTPGCKGHLSHYYGNWANPTKRELVSYCEGDVDITRCETDEEFTAELRKLCDWLKEHTGMGAVDPGFSAEMKADFERIGCSDLLH